MWTDEVLTIELQKTERGLGFSILDYQDPLNPSETVIVIRSLVPGGVAQQDGRLIPGYVTSHMKGLSRPSTPSQSLVLFATTRGVGTLPPPGHCFCAFRWYG